MKHCRENKLFEPNLTSKLKYLLSKNERRNLSFCLFFDQFCRFKFWTMQGMTRIAKIEIAIAIPIAIWKSMCDPTIIGHGNQDPEIDEGRGRLHSCLSRTYQNLKY